MVRVRGIIGIFCSCGLTDGSHVAPLLIKLHCLPVATVIKFKPLNPSYRVLAGSAPSDLISVVQAHVIPPPLSSAHVSHLADLPVQAQQSRLI